MIPAQTFDASGMLLLLVNAALRTLVLAAVAGLVLASFRGSVRRLVAPLSVMAPAIHTGSAAGLAADCRPVSLIWHRDRKLR